MQYILVFVGGGLGSITRFGIGNLSIRFFGTTFPYGTLISNLLSAFIIGALVALAFEVSRISDQTRLLLITGFCGGFSTFSAFTSETFMLLRNHQATAAIMNILISIIGSLIFFWAGWKIIIEFYQK
ncbi:MAG TPA: fluoride efflux transporter CrcB [Bacteroidia bacterium]|nr:MAG: CrcB protein [Bacteroidetes bacterium OLB10]MBE7508803.1 fluoride efflux transporter CrcB [Bacteroidia bacterium]MBX3105880.1 fluoride efflux transporter CrcB [Bacteroidota bacterium]MCB0848837.1 fluoride efflux transporter CrcB [Bacteroidota bacterium]MCB8929724.1 fluoride efflux transporter CrcB [Bacteroidia bacterium]